MKQTAVEWLIHQMLEASINTETEEMYIKLPKDSLKQAKAMEKEQIIEAWNVRAKIDGVLTYTDNRTAEQYYKQTYESNTRI